MEIFVSLASVLLKGLLEWAAPLVAYMQGRKDKQAAMDNRDAKILQKQRDNNVDSVDGANRVWFKIRKEQRK